MKTAVYGVKFMAKFNTNELMKMLKGWQAVQVQ